MRCAILAPVVMTFVAACSSSQFGADQSKDSVSPGTVTLRLLPPSGQEFCDIIANCSGPTHVFMGKESGNWLPSNPGPCGGGYACSTCAPGMCTSGACNPGTFSVPMTSVQTTWDGSYVDWSTCGSGAACYIPRFVAPGRYVARLCATPGTTSADGITCTQTGPEECVETTFELPGPTLVEVPLR